MNSSSERGYCETTQQARPMLAALSEGLNGTVATPGDKSISHRALLLGSQRLGRLEISGLLDSADVRNTCRALQSLGVPIDWPVDGLATVQGVGIGGLQAPTQVLDMGNSGTAARLLMGLVAPYSFVSVFTGDHSLVKRPMKRVLNPLSQMGMDYMASEGERLPLSLKGPLQPLPIDYTCPVASAQVKSAILLAGLSIAGRTRLIEKTPTRDHTERMAQHYGFALSTTQNDQQQHEITIEGFSQPPYSDATLSIAGDPSSAAFPAVAALITTGSHITLEQVGINPHRTGLYHWLEQMGASLQWSNQREIAGEPVADLSIASSTLKGIDIPAEAAPSMIDEYPILAVAAAHAEGTTILRGLSELRVKESDRLQAIHDGLHANGIKATIEEDDLIIQGVGQGNIQGGGTVRTHYDHRIAMAFLVMGLASKQPVCVDDASAIRTSFPDFLELMQSIGAHITYERRQISRSEPHRRLVIAIDGPAASGKGTLAHQLSRHLQLPYLDTGSLYRAAALRLLSKGHDPNQLELAIQAAKEISEQELYDPALRQEAVGNAASIVSAMSEVRQILLEYQRQFAQSPRGAILDGRDIGTVVCPQADIKLFMVASVQTRAKRRHEQLQGQGIEVIYESVLKELQERDRRDSERQSAPLKPAEDAITIDTTSLSIEEVFEQVLHILHAYNATQEKHAYTA